MTHQEPTEESQPELPLEHTTTETECSNALIESLRQALHSATPQHYKGHDVSGLVAKRGVTNTRVTMYYPQVNGGKPDSIHEALIKSVPASTCTLSSKAGGYVDVLGKYIEPHMSCATFVATDEQLAKLAERLASPTLHQHVGNSR